MLPIKRHRVSVQIKRVRSFFLKAKVTQSCPTLWDPMDCSLPGLSWIVHGILQARILDWLAVPFSRGSSQPRDWTQASHFAGGFFTGWATREAQYVYICVYMYTYTFLARNFMSFEGGMVNFLLQNLTSEGFDPAPSRLPWSFDC